MNIEETSDFTKVINAKRFNGPDELAADYLKERNESKASYPKDELDDLPPFIVPHPELDLLNRSPVEWPQVQAVDNPMHCEV